MQWKQWGSFILIKSFLELMAIIPHRLSKLIACLFARVIFIFAKQRRHVSLANLYRSNLELSQKDAERIARKSFENYAITCFEYGRLSKWKKNLSRYVTSRGEENFYEALKMEKGLVLLSGHQSNWEIPFLDVTNREFAFAVGRPLKKNLPLYEWVVKQRQCLGGEIITPKETTVRGAKILRNKGIIGLVGDQAHVPSSYSYPFLGVEAQTYSTPAVLAYKFGCPLIVITTHRTSYGYEVCYHPPLLPNKERPFRSEVVRMMDQSLSILEKQVKNHPEEWMWAHKFWKRVRKWNIPKPFCLDYNILIAPTDPCLFDFFKAMIPYFQHWIPDAKWKVLGLDEICKSIETNDHVEVENYASWEEGKEHIKGAQQVFDFIGLEKEYPLFERWGVSHCVSPEKLKSLALEKISDKDPIFKQLENWMCL
jgi:lauroyl/myristoyl acyltransferase